MVKKAVRPQAQQLTSDYSAFESHHKLTRALLATNNCNQALLYTTDEIELLQKICNIMVDIGGYRMAWAGYAELDEAKSVRAVALAGFDDGYIEAVREADASLGLGPTGLAIRTGEPCIIRDIRHELRFKPLLTQALERGYASVQSVPLKTDHGVIGAITIYSATPDAFDSEESKLLRALTDNIAYGIAMLRSRKKSELAEEALRKSERNFRSITEQIAEVVYVADSRGMLTFVSPLIEKVFGFRSDEFIGHHFSDYMAEEDIPEALRLYNHTLLHQEKNLVAEFKFKKKDGSLFDGEVHWQYYEDQAISGMIGLIRDISDRKQQERIRQENERKLLENQLFLQSIFNDVNFSVFVVDVLPDGTYRYKEHEAVNAKLIGLLHLDFSGKTPEEAFGAEAAKAIHHKYDACIQAGTPIQYTEYVPFLGKDMWWETALHPVRDASGHIFRIIGTTNEVTERRQNVLKTRELRDRYEATIEAAQIGTWDWNVQTGAVILNKRWFTMLGYRPEELAPVSMQTWVERAHPDDYKASMGMVEKLFNGETNYYEFESRLKHKNGTWVWVHVRGSLLSRTPDGKPLRMFGTNIDITERKLTEHALQESEKSFRVMFEKHSAVKLVIEPGSGKIINANQAAADFYGWSLDELRGMNIQQITQLTPEELKSNLEKAKTSKQNEFQVRHKRADGLQRDIELFSNNIEIDGKNILYAIIHDITDRKQAAEESDRLKAAFLANISHEIRTPMNGILGFSELFKEPDLTGEEKEEYIDLIHQSGLRMLNLINDLMDISKIDAREVKLQITETSANKLLREVEAFFKPAAKKKGVELRCTMALSDNDSFMTTDCLKLNQIITNLIQNALKFTTKGSIDFGYNKKKAGLEFFVIDTGRGIPADKKEKIFERFQQVDNSLTRAHEGAGLGLSISKAYVEMLGGTIHVESKEGVGSTFTFTHPYKQIKKQQAQSNKDKVLSTCNSALAFCLLIVEDDEVSTLLLKRSLKNQNISILCAENGWEAVELVQCHPEINLVLMDLKMPVMSGYDATKKIKQLRPDLPVIAQSAFTTKEEKQKAREAGCSNFITKPINNTELHNLIQELLP